jgi:hypothetical protein
MKPASRLLAAAFILTILSRLAFILLPRVPLQTKAVTSVGDSREYIALAHNLATSHAFTRDTVPPFRPELFRTPLYPLLLALPFIVHRPSFIVLALVLQLLLSLLTVWLTRRLALELGLAPVTASFAALLVGLSPNLAFLSSKLISESLFTPLLLISVLLLNRYRLAGRAVDLTGAGVCSGLLILTRPIATYFPLVIALYFVFRPPIPRPIAHRSWLVPPVLFLACASVIVAPWVIRNGRKAGRHIISTASEHNIYLYDAATVFASQKGITIPQARDVMKAEAENEFGPIDTTDEATMWNKLATVARRHLFRKPALFAPVWLFGVAADFLNPISVGPLLIHSGASPAAGSANLLQSSLAQLVKGKVTQAFKTAWKVRVGGAPTFVLVALGLASLFNLILIWFGLAGLFMRRSSGLHWLLLPVIYFTFVTGTVGDARFRAPIEPLLCIFAAVALVRPPRHAAARPQDHASDAALFLDPSSCSIGLDARGANRCSRVGIPVTIRHTTSATVSPLVRLTTSYTAAAATPQTTQ